MIVLPLGVARQGRFAGDYYFSPLVLLYKEHLLI